MIAYHGTVVGGLDVLKPFANPHSNLSYPCVYLSTCKALAAIYIWKHPFKWMTFEIPEDGIPLYKNPFRGVWPIFTAVSRAISTPVGGIFRRMRKPPSGTL